MLKIHRVSSVLFRPFALQPRLLSVNTPEHILEHVKKMSDIQEGETEGYRFNHLTTTLGSRGYYGTSGYAEGLWGQNGR